METVQKLEGKLDKRDSKWQLEMDRVEGAKDKEISKLKRDLEKA